MYIHQSKAPKMKSKEQIQKELNELGVNLPSNRMPLMEIPAHYFDSFPASMTDYVRSTGFLASLPIQMPFEIPETYFEQFSNIARDTIREENLIEALPKKMPYAVPEYYFSELSDQINSKVKTGSNSAFIQTFLPRLSLAATVLLFMVISLKIFLNPAHTMQANSSVENQLASISDEEFNQYLIHHQAEIESSLVVVNVDESAIDLQKLEFEMLDHTFNNVSDEELINYTL